MFVAPPRKLYIVFGIATAAVALSLLFAGLTVQVLHFFWFNLRILYPAVLLSAGAAYLVFTAVTRMRVQDKYSYRSTMTGKGILFTILGVILFIIGVALLPTTLTYQSRVAMFEASESSYVNSDEADYFISDTSYYNAQQASSYFMSGQNVRTQHSAVVYLPSDNVFTRLVSDGEGMSVQIISPDEHGNISEADISMCRFNDNSSLSLDSSFFTNSLMWEILKLSSPSTRVNAGDAFGVCEDGIAKIYVPITKLSGDFYAPYSVPAGVAVYDSSTDTVTLLEDVESSEYPVYPQSLASAQRTSLNASGGLFDWLGGMFFPSVFTADSEVSNNDLMLDMSLPNTTGGDSAYVTSMLTGEGEYHVGSTVSVVNQSVYSGQLAPVKINRYQEPVNDAATASSDVRSALYSYGVDLTGVDIVEVAPHGSDEVVVYVNDGVANSFTATLTSDGYISIFDEKGTPISSDLGESGDSIGDMNLSGFLDSDITELEDDDLKKYGDLLTSRLVDINEELSNRLLDARRN